MIKFHCKNCGQKISVPKIHAGKKGKCPKCKNIVVVPRVENTDLVKDYRNLNATSHHKSSSPVSDIQLEKEPPNHTGKMDKVFANGFEAPRNHEWVGKIDEAEKAAARKLPWLIDIFLYPTSISGLVNLGIFWILPILLRFIATLLPIPIVWFLVWLVIIAYMFYYFTECIRDSALGGIRAPENIGNLPDVGDAFSRLMEIVASVVIFWGPVVAYSIYKIFWQPGSAIFVYDPKTDAIFWLLLGYGIFFFPMGLLALVMFKSTSAFNPFLWVASIFSTFFQYCCLVLFFCVLGWLVSKTVFSFPQSHLFAYLFGAAFIYLAMVAAHLLGRFYYLNSEKLNWEV